MANQSDNFNRADGALGTSSGGGVWSLTGTWVVSSNTGLLQNNVDGVAIMDCGVPPLDHEATFPTMGSEIGFSMRSSSNGQSALLLAANNGSNTLKLMKRTAGNATFASEFGATISATLANGDTIKVEDRTTTIEVFINGVSAGSWNHADLASYNTSNTYAGLFSYGNGTGTIDNWSAVSPATMTIDRANVLCGSGTVTINITGTGTSWSGSPFSLTGAPTGWSISSQNVVSGTSATVTLNKGSGTGSFTVTDGSVSDTVVATNTATSAATGNWATAATWDVIEVPVSGNRAVVGSGHTVTVAANATIGDSPADATTWVLDVASGGQLTVNANIALTVKGNMRVGGIFLGGDSTTGGGALEIDGTTSATAHVLQLGTATGQTSQRFRTRGTTGSKFEVRSNSGGPNAKITSLQNSGFFDCEDTRFLRLGTTSVNGLETNYDTADYDQTFLRCKFDACGRFNWGQSCGADGGWTVTYCEFVNQLTGAACFRPLVTGAKNAGTVREVKFCLFDCPTITEVPNLQVSSNAIEDCALRNGIGGTQVPAAWTRGLLYYDDGASARSGSALYSDQTDVYVCTNSDHASGNAHMLLVSQSRTYVLDGTQFDNTMVAGEDTSDLYYGAQSLTQTVTITRMIVGKNPVTGSGSGVINPNSPDWRINHCSAWSNGAVVMLGDLDLAAGTVTQFKSNAVKGVTSEHLLRYVHHNSDPSASGSANVLTASGATNNASSGLSAGQEGGGYNTYNTDGTPGTSDLFGTDPSWVDGTRNMGSWAVARGYSVEDMISASSIRAAYDDAWEAIKSDLSRMTDLYDWRQAGFVPTAESLRNAGHDGEDIGAVDMTSNSFSGNILQSFAVTRAASY
jgi:hypothetical protein